MKPTMVLVALLSALVAAASLAFGAASPPVVYGVPFTGEKVTVAASAIGITANLCVQAGGQESAALVQVLSNSIYYTLHSATATPVATDYSAAAGDWIYTQKPSTLRMIQNSGAATAVVTCITQPRM